ncbi:MAG TPA: hypothetical protein VFB78_03690 [Acidimicrobiales bacterium]|nr:hypothetical protein [Acidimicrobiales bacterium]
MTCIDAYVPIGIRSCVTHLTNGNDPFSASKRNQQLSAIEPLVNPYVNAFIGVFLGGDFNVTAWGDGGVLSKIYSSAFAGFGGFTEVENTRDSCDPVSSPCDWTKDQKKIDCIFVDKYNWTSLSATTSTPLISDHKILKGHAFH